MTTENEFVTQEVPGGPVIAAQRLWLTADGKAVVTDGHEIGRASCRERV